MSLWIRAICTRSVGTLADLDLLEATRDADFMTWGEDYDLDEDESLAYQRSLRFERDDARPDAVDMHYAPSDAQRPIGIERWTGASAQEEIGELVERLEGDDSDVADRIRDVLARATETIAFELKLSDAQSMGWPIAWQTAMWLAKRGAGLVLTDDPDQWWDPSTYEVILEA